jgi:hypothetical protein
MLRRAVRLDGRKFRIRFLALVLGVSGCALVDDDPDFPSSAIPLSPLPEFRIWWEIVESCSGRAARFDDVKWFEANEITVRGELARGAWFSRGNRIALVGAESFFGPLVRHEMLHAILQDGDHPNEYFESRCRDIVACGRDCGGTAVPGDMTPISLSNAAVTIAAFPKQPSIGRHEGRMSFIVSVQNTSERNAYLYAGDYATAQCHAGILLTSVLDPDRSLLSCDSPGFGDLSHVYSAGETRSVVIDVNLQNSTGGDGPFFAETLLAGAVLADNVRRTLAVTLRP